MTYTLSTPIADTTNLLRVAAFIDRPEYEGHFNMAQWLDTDNWDDLTTATNGEIDDTVLIGVATVENPNTCGTSACIGGTAEALMIWDTPVNERRAYSSKEICEWLGLPTTDEPYDSYGGPAGTALFSPSGRFADGSYATNLTDGHRAARVLRHLAETGIIDWSKAERQEGDA